MVVAVVEGEACGRCESEARKKAGNLVLGWKAAGCKGRCARQGGAGRLEGCAAGLAMYKWGKVALCLRLAPTVPLCMRLLAQGVHDNDFCLCRDGAAAPTVHT